jgi:hypothetical protein
MLGRNSCSGGSMSRMVTGLPSIALKMPSKSACCSGATLLQGGFAVGVGLGQDELLDELAAVAEEHVLGAAQADALGAEAHRALGVLRGVGVGPHPRRRLASAMPMIRCTARTSSSVSAPAGSSLPSK